MYLTYCIESLEKDAADTVLLGQALGESDIHIARALNSGSRRRIAIGIHRTSDQEILEFKTRMLGLFGERHDLEFFDSATHQLADPGLRITLP